VWALAGVIVALLFAAPASAAPIAANSGPVTAVEPEDTYFVGAARQPRLTFMATSDGPETVEVFSPEDGTVVSRLPVEAQAGSNTVTWDGRTADGFARQGRYEMRLEGATEGASFELAAHVFPIRGDHDLGRTATNGFGGGRGHNGHDMFAACGTPVVAARAGKVREVAYNGAAGHHVVIASSVTGFDYVYMHLRARPLVRERERVHTGQPLGAVGRTGNAWGCHLHFELWRAPGWFAGGQVIDPLGHLRAWDKAS
jgi:murein DD-endopeptidase MepM/ murein hydrolase activator NlpD